MPVQTASLDLINDFLAQKRIAMVGISHEPKEFSVYLYKEFLRRGYDVVPVNPNFPEFLGRKCFAHVQDIEPPVDAALLMTSPAVTDSVVQDCAEAGIKRVWMYRAGGHGYQGGAVSESAVHFCEQRGIRVIPGECPFMFFPRNGFHAIHGFIRKLTGSFPKHSHN